MKKDCLTHLFAFISDRIISLQVVHALDSLISRVRVTILWLFFDCKKQKLNPGHFGDLEILHWIHILEHKKMTCLGKNRTEGHSIDSTPMVSKLFRTFQIVVLPMPIRTLSPFYEKMQPSQVKPELNQK